MATATKEHEPPTDEVFAQRKAAHENLEYFAEKDYYPPLNKFIHSLQAKDVDFIVFLDEHDRVEYDADDDPAAGGDSKAAGRPASDGPIVPAST